ncbi:Vegetative incompatibility protein HET-E-1 [Colletotrichum sp. SAR 10_86]|nr:Vegetative incompatibility protein HET-E-1 [Colletotrichum sp. SAR 10_75]KAI8225975.1 Vegetative incompatibility protein HET-E-1 [Colletotrichum sp. SAR 10_86]
MKPVISQVLQANPTAAVAWVGVSLALEILVNPMKESAQQIRGITYVVSRMGWYWSLVDLLGSKGLERQVQLRQRIETQFGSLYQKLLLYQMRSVCRYYRNIVVTALRDLGTWDDWGGQVVAIETSEAALMRDFKTYNDQVSLDHSEGMLDFLGSIDSSMEEMQKGLQSITSAVQCLVTGMEKIQDNQERQNFRNNLFNTNPVEDKQRIMDAKGGLLQESYEWILALPEFRRWQANSKSRQLWIRGDPGKGKTMLLCGIIEELEKNELDRLCYFFCQATDPRLNNATSVLRGLIYQLVTRYPWLLEPVVDRYKDGGDKRFEGPNAWETMSEILVSILNDQHRSKLLRFIKKLSDDSRTKIIVSSRKWTEIDESLSDNDRNLSTITLELHDSLITKAVESYIDRQVAQLANRKKFDDDICFKIRKHLRENSHDTFLWVSLVCQALFDGNVKKHNVMKVVKTFPPGLDALYTEMVDSIPSVDAHLCREMLAIVSVLKRPVTVEELLPLIQSPFDGDVESLEVVITCCGSFFNIQGGKIYFVHQSAVDFLQSKAKMLPSIADRHYSVFRGSLEVLNKPEHLKRDIYGLQEPGMSFTEIEQPNPNPLSALQYCCIYWVDHLVDWAGVGTVRSAKPLLKDPDVVGIVQDFLRRKFIYWVEAMALLHRMPEAVRAIQRLQTVIVRQ